MIRQRNRNNVTMHLVLWLMVCQRTHNLYYFRESGSAVRMHHHDTGASTASGQLMRALFADFMSC